MNLDQKSCCLLKSCSMSFTPVVPQSGSLKLFAGVSLHARLCFVDLCLVVGFVCQIILVMVIHFIYKNNKLGLS